jgi:uroporphyrinogen-III synthase
MPDALAGFTVAVTADRRRDELATLLEGNGARVVLAPALRVVPLVDDVRLREVTRSLLERPPDAVVADTAIGMQGWLEAADAWGLGGALRACLAAAHVVARWPRTSRDMRTTGPPHAWSPTGSSVEVLEHLVSRMPTAQGGRGRPREPVTTVASLDRPPLGGWRIAVQLHGEPHEELCGSLVAAGAEVIEIQVSHWAPPIDPTPLHRLVDLITNRLVDGVTFTSAPAVASVLRAAGPQTDAVLDAMRTHVLTGCVGPLAAEPLRRLGVPVLSPARARVTALVRAMVAELPRRTRTLQVAGAELVLRGHAAVVDGILKPLPPAQMAILRSLAASPGKVLPRSQLLESLPRGADEHAVEMAVARLRAALGAPSFIQTVVKRGYRLRIE